MPCEKSTIVEKGVIYHMEENKIQQVYAQLPIAEKNLSLSREERLTAMVPPLHDWYTHSHRILPWREHVTPYKVWVSEIMLQQTRVEAVKPYYARFLAALPDITALANAEEELLLKLWEGLGYYSRVRNMQAAAIQCVAQHDGELPDSYAELLKLKGIGTYTAGAIASIAFHEPVPAVDGNVLRVIARLTADEEDIGSPKKKKQLETELAEQMHQTDPGILNQALMELGAVVCLPNGTPKCQDCPLHHICLSRMRRCTDRIPYKKPKKPRKIEERTILILETGEQVLLRKRPGKGLLAGMYEFPGIDGHLDMQEALQYVKETWESVIFQDTDIDCVIEPLGPARHIFTHIQWEMIGYRIRLVNVPVSVATPEFVWASREELQDTYSIPSALRVYKEKCMQA